MVFSSICALNVSADWETTEKGVKYWSSSQKAYATGWWILGGETYYFDTDGYMHTGWLTDEAGRTYYFRDSGKMLTGWLKTNTGNRYYFEDTGIMHTGWLELKNNYYYLRKSGKAVLDKTVTINGVSYTFDETGKWDGNGTAPDTDAATSETSTKSLSEQYKEAVKLKNEAYENVKSYQAVYDENTAEKQKWVDKMNDVLEKIDKIKAKYKGGKKNITDSDKALIEKYNAQYDEYRATAVSYDNPISTAAKKKTEWSKLYKEYKAQAKELYEQIQEKKAEKAAKAAETNS